MTRFLNVNGGAIAMGHPLGATGAMILGTVLDELERTNKQTALVTLCVLPPAWASPPSSNGFDPLSSRATEGRPGIHCSRQKRTAMDPGSPLRSGRDDMGETPMTMTNFRLETDADGIATLTWDMPDRSMNVITPEVMADLNTAIDTIVADPAIKGCVITSGKEPSPAAPT